MMKVHIASIPVSWTVLLVSYNVQFSKALHAAAGLHFAVRNINVYLRSKTNSDAELECYLIKYSVIRK